MQDLWMLRALSWVMPELAAHRAEKIFLTPTRIPRPSSERDFYDSAKKVKLSNGLMTFHWGSVEAPRILLVHGWNGRGTQLGAFAEPLISAGYQVIAMDGPAHGESDGDETNVGNFSEAVLEVQKHYGALHGVIAHSMGAGSAVVARMRGLDVKKLILIGGPSRYEVVVGNFLRRTKLSPWSRRIFLKNLVQKVGLNIEQLDIGEILSELQASVLVIHDEDDKEVRYRAALEIKEKWPQTELMTTRGLGHRRVLRDPQVIATSVSFLR